MQKRPSDASSAILWTSARNANSVDNAERRRARAGLHSASRGAGESARRFVTYAQVRATACATKPRARDDAERRTPANDDGRENAAGAS
ncbi:hypothetical protein GCM10027029_11080 [Conyzicola lurida]